MAETKPRIGCTSWCFHLFTAGTVPEEAIDIIGELGFDGIELIVLAPEDMETYWTDTKVDQLKKQLERHGLAVAQFVLFQPVVEGLTSRDAGERERNLDHFTRGCRLGQRFGAPLINIVAPWPRELSGPTGYLPRYYEIKDPQPGQKFTIDIAPGFDWDELWANYVATTRACVERAKACGMKFSIEHHTHCMVHDATSFLRLWEAVGDPALGYNMDIGWTLSQREYPPVAIHKVKDQLVNLHARDIDGLMRSFVHVGEGVMDFQAVADALKSIGFTGFISLEQDKHPGDMRATCRRYLEIMRACLG
jgi:sugar phosphate isomerase/epimerase